jgi:transcriptional regulator GlxA family with amidase domain
MGGAGENGSALIRAATGVAQIDYVENLRIEEARRKLEGGLDAVDVIAAQVGNAQLHGHT